MNKGVKSTPFLDHAPKYWDMGLPVFPLKAGSKEPAVRNWQYYKGPPSAKTQATWLRDFSDANLGLVVGKNSCITIVDIDDPALDTGSIQEEFGKAGAIVRTASGTYHLYYRYNGEAREIRFMERKVDILGDGGYVVLPPSIIPEVGSYTWIEEDISARWDFPTISEEALCKAIPEGFVLPERIEKGTRNKMLFKALRWACYSTSHDYDSLYTYALEITHGQMAEPLDTKEVRDCVKSVWCYWLSGKLVPPKTRYAVIWELPSDLEAHACKLFVELKKVHAGVRSDFKIMARAMNIEMSEKTIKKARDVLLARGLIECIYRGGKGAGDPSRYRFVRGPILPPIQ